MLATRRLRPTPPFPPATTQTLGPLGVVAAEAGAPPASISGCRLMQVRLLESLAGERNEPRLVIHERGERSGPLPDALDVPERVLGIVHAEGNAFEAMAQQQLALVAEVSIRHLDERQTPVGELEEELQLDLPEAPRADLVQPGLGVE